MKFHILIITSVFGALFGFASATAAQTKDMPQTGAYKTVSVKDENIIEAADFAIVKQAEISEVEIELVSIENAEAQVSAGTNFRLCMKITAYYHDDDSEENEESEEVTGFARVIIFRDIKGEFSLTSWTVVENCGKK